MTRTDYLAQLDKYLKRLPAEDYKEAMDYFTEYFDEAGPENEAQVIQDLGSPKEAAQEILHEILDKTIKSNDGTHKSRAKTIWIAILALFASPIAIPVILLLIMMLVTLILAIIATLFTGFVFAISMIITMGVLLWEAVPLLGQSWSVGLMGIGISLLFLAGGLFAYLIVSGLTKFLYLAVVSLVKWLTRKRRTS